jgi:signal transduction histidine kinase
VMATLISDDDTAACLLYQVHDLTPHKRAAEQVAELALERVRRKATETQHRSTLDSLARFNHEMRTPLNAVLGYGQLLQMEMPAADTALHGYADRIVNAGRHLLSMVDDVSAAESGAPRAPQRVRIELRAAVDAAVQLLAPQAQALQVRQAVDLPDAAVQADATRLQQVLLNIGSNAVKYNRPGGCVLWSAEPDDPQAVTLVVADDGLGMTPEQIEQLFQPYQRLGMEHSAIPGTGLGLAITRDFVQQMGGTISVHRRPQGGTEVRVRLLRAQ